MTNRFLITVYPEGKQFDVPIDDIKAALCVVFALGGPDTFAELRWRP